jgi:hypothetical protein
MHVVTVAAVLVMMATSPSASRAAAEGSYELVLRTSDALMSGTVELEERVVVSVKGDRLRQEATGTRSVLTRRGARYVKPGHRVTLEQVGQGRRYELNLEARTYVEESFARLRARQEAELTAAERALGVDPGGPAPTLAVSVERTGERRQVHGRECERVVLRSARELLVAATRGAPAPATPSRFVMTFDLCLTAAAPPVDEARALEDTVDDLTGLRGPWLERQLRVFAHRRDVFAVFELMHRLMEREQRALGGVALAWERVLVGPRRDEPRATLFRQTAEITRIEPGALEAASFELPPGLSRVVAP